MRRTTLIVPFSQQWHDDMDLDGHVPMPYNAEGQGPEMDPALVVRTVCWCWRQEECEVYPPHEGAVRVP